MRRSKRFAATSAPPGCEPIERNGRYELTRTMKPVRLGAVEYLNARPLVFRLERSPRFVVRFDWPSRCAALLHDDAIDVGLIPSIEYLRAPASAVGVKAYRIVPDLAIASHGPVASVAIYTTKSRSPMSVRSRSIRAHGRRSRSPGC